MSTEIIRLVRIDFDGLENHTPRYETDMGTFGTTPAKTAYARLRDWMEEQTPIKHYVGYDKQVYPQFRLEEKRLM